MPRRPRPHQLEDLSRNKLHAAFESAGWTVEDLSKDYGEDLLVRLFEAEIATPYSFFVQAKATDNLERYRSAGSGRIRFQIETGHVRHWIRFSEPVFLTLYDSKSDKTYWVCIQSALPERPLSDEEYRKKFVTIDIPEVNLLDGDGLLRIQGITKLRFDRIEREREGARILIEMLEERFKVRVDHYSPLNEHIQITNEDGGGELIFFGAFAERMKGYVEKANMSGAEFLVKAARAYLAKPVTSDSKAQSHKLLEQLRMEMERAAGRLPLK